MFHRGALDKDNNKKVMIINLMGIDVPYDLNDVCSLTGHRLSD